MTARLELFGFQNAPHRIHAGKIEYSESRLLGQRVTIKVKGAADVGMGFSGDAAQLAAARELLERAVQGPR